MTMLYMACIALRVSTCCGVFACFLFASFKTRLKSGYLKSSLLVLLYITITAGVTILFLTPISPLAEYNALGICFWFLAAMVIIHIAIRGSAYEIIFIILVTLNLYVNIVAIAKVIGNLLEIDPAVETVKAVLVLGVLAVYMPLLWLLMAKLYKQVIDFQIPLSFWKFIWIIPALTYLVFYVKIVHDYWLKETPAGAGDIIFIVLWSITTYAFFYVTLQMLIQAYKGITAMQRADFITSQMGMQKEQYGKLVENIEATARLKHDWRHHLTSINGFAEAEDMEGLRRYLKELAPEYGKVDEGAVCRNHIVDVILRHFGAIAKSAGIRMEISVDIPDRTVVSDLDLCVIFGNLVENAVEACQGFEGEKGYIGIHVGTKERQLIIQIKNTYRKKVRKKEGLYYSTKHDGVGIGLSSVKKVVDRYTGMMKVEYDDTLFTVQILFPNAAPSV